MASASGRKPNKQRTQQDHNGHDLPTGPRIPVTAQSILRMVKRDILDAKHKAKPSTTTTVKTKYNKCDLYHQQEPEHDPSDAQSDSDSSVTNPFEDSDVYVPNSTDTDSSDWDDDDCGFEKIAIREHLTEEVSQEVPDQACPNINEPAQVTPISASGLSRPKSKPFRPCVYCGVFQSQLKRHIVRKHGNEEAVQAALRLPEAVQTKAFDALRKEGIFKKNVEMMNGEESRDLIRERNQGGESVVMCTGCKGFFSKKTICKHKKHFCTHGAETMKFLKKSTIPCSEEFQQNILNKFRDDEAGQLCRQDRVILLLGQKAWAKSAKKERRVVMTEMRLMANLILQMRTVAFQPALHGENVIDRDNFDTLTNAIQNLSKRENSSNEKSALKITLGYLLKKIIRIMKGYYIQQDEMDRATEVERFQSVLDLNWDFIFYTAQLACEQRRNTLRKPSDMPLEEDVQRLRDFIMEEIKAILNDDYRLWGLHEFVSLRNLVVSRLTMYNARRGGEPARLTLSEWKEAEEGQWVDQDIASGITDPLEEALLGDSKLAYMAGKGSKKLVPVLIPNDTVEAVRKLIEERKNAGIVDENVFLFPNTSNSREHVSGYACFKAITGAMGDKLKKPSLLIADKFRHRASTLYALLDLPESERESWYRHMGHSAAINKDVYQSPLAIAEMTKVGGFLKKLDSHGKKAISYSVPDGASQQNMESETDTSQNESPAKAPSALDESNSVQSNEPLAESNSRQSIVRRLKRKRQYTQWIEEDAAKIATYFDKFIKAEGTGSKGSLPGVKEIEEFLSKFEIFKEQNIQKKVKISLIKTKVFNERNKFRNGIKGLFESC